MVGYASNRASVAIASGLVAVYLPLLLLFLTGLHAKEGEHRGSDYVVGGTAPFRMSS